jgi:hypothetical protein
MDQIIERLNHKKYEEILDEAKNHPLLKDCLSIMPILAKNKNIKVLSTLDQDPLTVTVLEADFLKKKEKGIV